MLAARLMALNQRVLDVLTQRPGADVSQIVHYAGHAGDEDAIAAHGPAAARHAVRRRARTGKRWRTSALVLEHAGRFSPQEQARLLEQYAVESCTVGASDIAVGAMRRAVALNRAHGNDQELGASLRWLSRMHWTPWDRTESERTGGQAMAAAERAGEPGLLGLTLSNQSQLMMLAHRTAEAIVLGERAVALARKAGDDRTLSHALNNVGTARWFEGNPACEAMIEEALQVALAAHDTEDACRAYVNLTWTLLDRFQLDEAEGYLQQAVKLAEEAEFLGFLSYMRTEQARLALARGQWDDAVRYAELSMELSMWAHRPTQMTALTVQGPGGGPARPARGRRTARPGLGAGLRERRAAADRPRHGGPGRARLAPWRRPGRTGYGAAAVPGGGRAR